MNRIVMDAEKALQLSRDIAFLIRDFHLRELAALGPTAGTTFAALNAIAANVALLLNGCPDGRRDEVRRWFDEAIAKNMADL